MGQFGFPFPVFFHMLIPHANPLLDPAVDQ